MYKLLIATSLAISLAACTTTDDSSVGDSQRKFLGPNVGYSDQNLLPSTIDVVKLPEAEFIDYPAQLALQETVTQKLLEANKNLCEKMKIYAHRCKGINVTVENGDVVNSYAWGRKDIAITAGALKLVENEHEMAMLIAHDAAHLIAAHVEEIADNKGNSSGGAVVMLGVFQVLFCGVACSGSVGQRIANHDSDGVARGFMTKNAAFSFDSELEQEADYISAYLMRNAGFEIDKGVKIYKKLAKFSEKTNSVTKGEATYFDTHSASSDRFVRLILTDLEIDKKKSEGLDLVPEG